MNQFGASVFTRPMLVDESCEVPYVARYETAASILLLNNLRTLGLPAYQWPDLPPEVLNNAESHIQAKKLFQVNIFLPIHQTITEKDLARLYQPKRSYTYGLIIKSWSDSEEDWDEMVARAEFSNILQCSAYGSAKENSGGWKVERYVINRGDVPIAFLQILKKSFLGLLTLYRLSRGPLFFENISIDERAQACYLIRRKFGSLKRRKVLSWAPELLFNGENLILLWQMRVRRFSAHNWISDVIDLSLGEDELRAKLSTKWRNLLNDSKRKGVTTRLSHSPSEYTRLLECCERTLGDRGVHFPIKLYRELHHLILDKQHKYLHLIAESSGKSLASIYVVIHGKTATYLLGWNSEDGRHLRAHNLLLWDALLRLKDQSLSYFDLGGVDFENTPGIASFKSGLRGDRYQLVGECFCF